MKRILLIITILFQYSVIFSQTTKPNSSNIYLFEDANGRLITDPAEIEVYKANQQKALQTYSKTTASKILDQTAVQLCSNSGFEEFTNQNGVNVLKNFKYAIETPLNPIQCKSSTGTANLNINQYNPNDTNLMATTVPSNHLDEFIGDIEGFDQYCLKLNYRQSTTKMAMIQTKRFKTDNENVLNFNYKAVLQSIPGDSHLNEQPYFKARIVNNSGNVVSEFCLIANTENCIYTKAPVLSGNSIILYTKNWQSGSLDISSIPNNESFTIEFITTRCGLMGHFGYSYIDDICTAHTDENLQGSIELDPLYLSCPNSTVPICGNFTVPNSGDVKANVKSIALKVYNSSNILVYNTTNPTNIDLDKKRFCFDLDLNSLPNITTENYNVSATINYEIDDATQNICKGTSFNEITDDDANPGWDITFLNCDPKCNLQLKPASLSLCDDDKNGKEIFNLTDLESLITVNPNGITFNYYTNLDDATLDKNPIANFNNYESFSTTLFVRATSDPDCYKIIAVKLFVKNPSANISGVLNICSGSTLLTATKGASYLWSTGETTQSINATQTGLYTVIVTDSFGCQATGEVTILPSSVAAQPTIRITQPDCFNQTGTITVVSPASQYSYDDGKTWSTNSAIQLPIGTYNVKIRTSSGCESYSTKISLVPFLSSYPNYAKTNPNFCGDLGSITITTAASSYSFDDGATWSEENTKTNLPSGNYHIRTKDAFGCISNFNNVELFSEFLPAAKFTIAPPNCTNLGSITITTPASSYSFDGGTTWQTSNTKSNLTIGSYVIIIKNELGCTSVKTYAYLTSLENSYPTYKITEAGCGTYASIEITTSGDLYSFDNGLHWTSNPILNNLNGGTNYQLIVQKGGSCNSRTQYAYINSYYSPIPVVNDFEAVLCDAFNDGYEIIDLTNYNSNISKNSSSEQFQYYSTLSGATASDKNFIITNFNNYTLTNNNNIFYVKVTTANGCSEIVTLKFILLNSPRIFMKDKYTLCMDKNVVIDAGSGYNSYLWSTGETTQSINITSIGDYWVNVTEKNGSLLCDATKNFNIFLSNPATITSISIKDWSDTENVISIFQSGLGDYEYSLDNITYQDNNTFTGLLNGEYTVYVRDKFGCGITTEEVYLLMYPRYFTPNHDGHNDTWKIKLSDFENGLTVKIFDRYGKLIKMLGNDSEGWNGTFNGKELPADDYWFIVTRADGKEYKGHFSLKR